MADIVLDEDAVEMLANILTDHFITDMADGQLTRKHPAWWVNRFWVARTIEAMGSFGDISLPEKLGEDFEGEEGEEDE